MANYSPDTIRQFQEAEELARKMNSRPPNRGGGWASWHHTGSGASGMGKMVDNIYEFLDSATRDKLAGIYETMEAVNPAKIHIISTDELTKIQKFSYRETNALYKQDETAQYGQSEQQEQYMSMWGGARGTMAVWGGGTLSRDTSYEPNMPDGFHTIDDSVFENLSNTYDEPTSFLFYLILVILIDYPHLEEVLVERYRLACGNLENIIENIRLALHDNI